MPDLVADLELQVPQRVQDRFDCVFIDRIFKEKQQIDIRLGMDRCAAISADRHQCETIRIIALAPELPNHFIQLFADDGFDPDADGIGQEFIL